jgi:tRNA nucleotidyltransferase (CCA-adding enzyme)
VKTYVVGGAVRDALLGRSNSDRDWVVVGATPEQMTEAGFVPVGRDFPVFLHPQTKEEYALARTERKTAPGYRGFVFQADPSVTLEEDLARRDLTINAMAMTDDGTVVDPHGGQHDLHARVLRHVSPAFSEDPVRILRLARFAARYPEFSVAPQTLALACAMVSAGEVDALVPERVWQELARGLMEVRPSRMVEMLRSCGALARLMPELDRLWGAQPFPADSDAWHAGKHLLRSIDVASTLAAPLPVRFACLVNDVDRVEAAEPQRDQASAATSLLAELCRRLRVPVECRVLAETVARESALIHDGLELDAGALLDLLERCDALRRPERFALVLLACECDARAAPGATQACYPQRLVLDCALQAALGVDSAGIAAREMRRGVAGPAVGSAIHVARLNAVESALGAAGLANDVNPGQGVPDG